MASGKYEYFSQALLNLYFGGTAYSPPGTLYFALFSVIPSVSTLGTEATGGGYTRVGVTSNNTNFPNISGTTTTIANATIITFPTGTGSGYSGGANMVAVGVFDASSGGNLLYWGALNVAKPILSGDIPTFPVSNFQVQEL
jgi:hypothetical protein